MNSAAASATPDPDEPMYWLAPDEPDEPGARAAPEGGAAPEPDPKPEPEPLLRLVPEDLPDASLTDEQLGSRIVGLSGRIAAATCHWLLLIADFDRRGASAMSGLGSTARWLSHHCGIAHRTALDHVRVARTLLAHRHLATEMAAGRVSYSHARAISRVVEPEDTDLVERLVDIAEHGTVGQLEDTVRGLRTVDKNEQDDADRKAGRPTERPDTLDSRVRSDSRWHLSARLAPERGAVVDAALHAVARAEKISLVDAFERIAEIALAALRDEDRLPRELRGDERTAIVVHLDARDVPPPPGSAASPATAATAAATESGADTNVATDAEPAAAAAGRKRPFARLADGPGLPDAVAYRLLCDGRLRTVVYETDPDGRRRVLDVGRCQRLVTRKQFRALVARDGRCCVIPGCGSRRQLHVHHVIHWLHGGLTDSDNLLLACLVHHMKIHDGEIEVRSIAPGRFRFFRADGLELAGHVDPSGLVATPTPADADHRDVADDAAHTRWDGTRLDRDYAVSVLAESADRRQRRRRRRRRSRPDDPAGPDAA